MHKLQRKWSIVTVFTTIHILCNLQMGPMSLSICHWWAFTALCNLTHQLIVQKHKLQRNWSNVNMVPVTVFTTINFLCNLQMGPMSLSICHWWAFTALCNLMRQHIVPKHKLQRNWSIVNMIPLTVFTTIHFLCNLHMGLKSLSICRWWAFPALFNLN